MQRMLDSGSWQSWVASAKSEATLPFSDKPPWQKSPWGVPLHCSADVEDSDLGVLPPSLCRQTSSANVHAYEVCRCLTPSCQPTACAWCDMWQVCPH
jgi:hypothetical protein